MIGNSRLTVAIHILTMLASDRNSLITSERIARSVKTNPVVIRRILGDLRRAELVESHAGRSGGWRLRHEPEQITLGDAYQAMREGPILGLYASEPNQRCPIGRQMEVTLQELYAKAEQALKQSLAQTTIADALTHVLHNQCGGFGAIVED